MASTSTAYTELKALFPISSPLPSILTHPDLVAFEDLTTEHELAKNPQQPTRWANYIHKIVEEVAADDRNVRGQYDSIVASVLGPRLATETGRRGLRRIVGVYERAISALPLHYTFWREYLNLRAGYVLGSATKRVKLDAPKRREERGMVDFLEAGSEEVEELSEGERDFDQDWEGALDGIVGFDEWTALAGVYERALMWLPNLPRFWLGYLNMFIHPECPSVLRHSHARKTFDRALRTLPSCLHLRIWKLYLIWSKNVATPEASIRVWRRYLQVDPTPTHLYVSHLLALDPPRPLEAARYYLSLSRSAATGAYKSPKGRSPYQLFIDFVEVCEKYPEQIGIELSESKKRQKKRNAEKDENGKKKEAGDTISNELLDVEHIIRSEGLEVYRDQSGRLWTGLATYWIKRGEIAHANGIFEEGIKQVLTLRDFTQIFDSYAEFMESYVSALMESIEDEEDEQEVEKEMAKFEALMDRRPFLVNDVLLRRNPNDVLEWEKRIALHGTNDQEVAETYKLATETINPRKAGTQYHSLWIHWAKFYEEGGVSGESEKDLENARTIFKKATEAPFKRVDELAEIWCEWAEMEVRNENYEEAIEVMELATQTPPKSAVASINYHDESVPAQKRLFKSLKLWSFFVDLEESIGTVESTKRVYNKMIELKIANAQIFVNFANFLEEHQYWEESFKIYERGLELFTFPIAFELWNIYLTKFLKRYGGDQLERARDLFEQALEKCPVKFVKSIYLLYGKMEEDYGLAKRAMNVYDRATKAVDLMDRMEMYTYYIAKVSQNFGLPATREIYQQAIQVLPDKQTSEMCLRFAALERKLGEIDRARAILAHASQFCDPRINTEFWKTWNDFEIETGSEDTFREYLRIKRAVQAAFNTEASYLAAKAAGVAAGGQQAQEAVMGGQEIDPMAALDAATGRNGFVPAQNQNTAQETNADEIQMDDDDE